MIIKFLQLHRSPYLVPVKGIGGRLIFEGCAIPCIQRGDKLFERGGNNMVGTFGVVMVSQQYQRLTYVGLTAGHVIPDGDTHMFIKNPKDQSMIDLKIATYSVRDEGRPLGRAKDSPNFQDDCGFLIIDEDKLPHFDHSIPCVDPHFYSSSNQALIIHLTLSLH